MYPAVKRGLLRALWAALLAVALGVPAQAQVLEMSRAEGLRLARILYLNGDAMLANAIARSLIAADPGDVEALLLMSASEEAMGNAQAALIYGRQAWEAAERAARPASLRYEIARQTAHAALSGQRNLTAQYWLQQSINVAPSPNQAAQSQQDLDITRQNSPLKATLSFQIIPTTNINGGSVTDLFLVDDVVIGGLSGWSEAQPGVIATANLDLLYALPGSGRDRFGISLTETLPKLAPWAARENPDLDDADLQSQSAVLRFEHDLLLPVIKNSARLTLSASQSWTDGAPAGPGLRSQLEVSVLDTEQTAILLTTKAERQWSEGQGGITDGISAQLDATRRLDGVAATLQMGLGATLLRSEWVNTTYDSYTISLGWVPDAPLGSVNWSVLVTGGAKHFGRYQPIGGGIDATNGRDDTSLGISLNLRTEEAEIFGLTPYVTLSQQASWSNISRNETLTGSVTLGLSRSF